MDKKYVTDSLTEQVQIVMPAHINSSNRLFGGQLVQWIDIVAAVVAKRHSGYSVTTVAIDNLQFKAGAVLDDTIVLIGRITYVGNTSMEVRVDTYIENRTGIRKVINRAYLVFVAIDDNHLPIKVPGIIIQTESQKAEWESGIRRRELRQQRRLEGF
ncbi:MAG TPA: acyl-CoA thioesterase [Clostridiales bacterium]|nr:acyl-CoA thioesterase [Clostridiales bacterium]